MNLVRSTGNGMLGRWADVEERKRMHKRHNAGDAYRRQAEYFQPKIPTLSQIEELLLGNKEKVTDTPSNPKTNIIDIKGPSIPVQTIDGPTLEKTVELLEKVRSTALAPAEPTPEDLRVAASASAKIQRVNAQITLNMEANRQIALEVKQQLEDEASISNGSVPSDLSSPKVLQVDLQKKRLKEQAIAKYSYQVHLKRYGFADLEPSFFHIA
ncbi:hypothetical protein OR571_12165 [Psychrobacillus sp. NEAU-3TGS]|uniref:hypothetical protein n=1 Tax=Psychrobacillus sp. NEAU-3TGS TaxID=2995412 RepID=UPI002495F431|nr:hypothetical protein [Psychrobacillus sp. NEAU-3TGS]MDI2587852.1 hypothetical protein [Psychrobacillus sp. NEAU-3TGS]